MSSVLGRRESTELKQTLKVPQGIYLKWVRQELDDEQACLELPLTILLLFAFSAMAVLCLAQDVIFAAEQAIELDIIENANFAFSDAMGHKGVEDAHSIADFWSWARLGFLPLLVQPTWSYSEQREEDLSSVFDLNYATSTAAQGNGNFIMGAYGKNSQALPVTGDYLHYNRIIGGIRFRQHVAEQANSKCKFPGGISTESWEKWYGKPCMPSYEELSFQPDSLDGETFANPERTEWVLLNLDNFDRMIHQLVDMEDGCAQLETKNRSLGPDEKLECYCLWCAAQEPATPWITEQTQRVEVGMASFNSEYGILTLTGVWKRVELMSIWINFSQPTMQNFWVLFFEALWMVCLLYVLINEVIEIVSILRNADDGWVTAMREDYIGIWNVVDWISIILALFVLVSLAGLATETSALHQSMADLIKMDASAMHRDAYKAEVQAFYDAIEKACSSEKSFRLSLSTYPMMVMLRLFKSFAAQPRLAVVTETLKEAAQDMLHFGIVLFSVVLTLCVDGVLLFGRDTDQFATVPRAVVNAVRMMFGDWDWEPMENINRISAYMWFLLFMVFIVIILLNMLLAIIMDNYMTVKKRSSKAQSLQMQMNEMLRRRQMLRRKERVRLNDIWDAFIKRANFKDKAALNSEEMLTADMIQEIVPGIPKSQAERTLKNSWTAHLKANEDTFELRDCQMPLHKLEGETRKLRNALFFVYDRLEFYDTRAESTSDFKPPAQPVADDELLPWESGDDHIEGEIPIVEHVEEEMQTLSATAAQELAGQVGLLDERQKRIEAKQSSIRQTMREAMTELLSLQSMAGGLANRLGAIEKSQRRSWNPPDVRSMLTCSEMTKGANTKVERPQAVILPASSREQRNSQVKSGLRRSMMGSKETTQ